MTPVTTSSAHRKRLLAAMAQTLRSREYHDVTIADIVQAARTSRRTFYEHFADKEECVVELLRDSVARTVRRIEADVDPEAPWPDQARQAIESLVGSVAAEPEVHLTWLRAAPSLGPRGRALSREAMASFIALTQSLADTPALHAAGLATPSRQQSIVLVGGLRELIDITLEEGGDLHDVVGVATDATMLLLGPRR